MTKRVILFENLPNLSKTSAQILRIIALHLCDVDEARVEYSKIALALNKDRDTVSKAIKRMIGRKILSSKGGKLSIPASMLVNV